MIVLLILVSYLLGSVPVAWIVAKAVVGRDLRNMGSGNVGVLNTALSVHRWAGLLVFAAEALKGMGAVVLARALDGGEIAVGLCVLSAIVGTRWPVWLRGQGGRGNTAAVAALVLVSLPAFLIMLVAYLATRFLAHSNFIAMRVSLLLLPFVLGLITQSWWMALFGACFSLLFLSTHQPETDDHLLLKKHWPTLWAFITAPPRK